MSRQGVSVITDRLSARTITGTAQASGVRSSAQEEKSSQQTRPVDDPEDAPLCGCLSIHMRATLARAAASGTTVSVWLPRWPGLRSET